MAVAPRYGRVRALNATTKSARLVSRSTSAASWETGNGLSKVAPYPLGGPTLVRSIPRLCVIVNGACMHHCAMVVTTTAPRGVLASSA
jgi:hypothetical protein